MEIRSKLLFLERIEKIYDSFAHEQKTVCGLYCADCCTGNVSVTSLEAFRIAEYILSGNSSERLFSSVENRLSGNRYIPRTTANMLPVLYAQGNDIPEEETHPDSGACPILTDNHCPVYPVRPFHCRCMMSEAPCRESGYAQVSPFAVTVNTVFLQYIEHLDSEGFSGNFGDMLMHFNHPQNRYLYKNRETAPPETVFIRNHPIRYLMIPPEHRKQIMPIIGSDVFRCLNHGLNGLHRLHGLKSLIQTVFNPCNLCNPFNP